MTTAGIRYNATTTTAAVQTVTGIGAAVGFANSMVSGSSAQGAWVIVNMLQALLLLPLVAWYISETVKNFIISNGFFTFSLGFLMQDHLDSIPFAKDLDFEQSNSYLHDLGMQSGSCFINNMLIMFLLVTLLIPHLLIS